MLETKDWSNKVGSISLKRKKTVSLSHNYLNKLMLPGNNSITLKKNGRCSVNVSVVLSGLNKRLTISSNHVVPKKNQKASPTSRRININVALKKAV